MTLKEFGEYVGGFVGMTGSGDITREQVSRLLDRAGHIDGKTIGFPMAGSMRELGMADAAALFSGHPIK